MCLQSSFHKYWAHYRFFLNHLRWTPTSTVFWIFFSWMEWFIELIRFDVFYFRAGWQVKDTFLESNGSSCRSILKYTVEVLFVLSSLNSIPSWNLLVQNQQQKDKGNVSYQLKVNNKDTRATSTVSICDYEQINFSWISS